jgi:hypothetical protein
MGFNKVYVDEEKLFKYLDNDKPLKKLFKADAFIFMDKISSYAFELYSHGTNDEQIKLKLKQYKDENNQSN